jgi:hypothetical protein
MTLARMRADCAQFLERHGSLLVDGACTRGTGEYSVAAQAGHDFWLTRNGHGAGFWDGDWNESAASALDAGAKEFGDFDLYVGDDGVIYGMGCEPPRGDRAPAAPSP